MAKLRYDEHRPYFSTFTGRYYPNYTEAFRDSVCEFDPAYFDFNLYLIDSDDSYEIVY